MPISSSACPCAAPPVSSLRPSRLATNMVDALVASAGTVIPVGGVTSLFADAALVPSVATAAAATKAAPTPRARPRFVVLVMVMVPSGSAADTGARPHRGYGEEQGSAHGKRVRKPTAT